MTEAVDVMHMGRDRVICAYLVDGLIVDPGPASAVERVFEALGAEEPRALLLTHIHLDHAGATGVLVRRFPRLRVYVRVEYTPGHASHHVAYLHDSTGDAFVGDVGGCRIPPSTFTVPPTPPPDIDLDAWRASLDLVSPQLQRVRDWLTYRGQRARVLDESAFVAEIRALAADAQDADAAASLFEAAPPEQVYAGLVRYWSKAAA